MAVVEITNENELREWLKGRDREVMRALASRGALRGLPLIVGAGRLGNLYTLSWALFRATAASEAGSVIVAESAADAADTAYADVRTFAAGNAEAASFDAIYAAAAAASAAYDDYTPHEHVVAAVTSVISSVGVPGRLFEDVGADIQFLDQNSNPHMLIEQPLWIKHMPNNIIKDWALLKAALGKEPDLHWDVWINWYEARLSGGQRNWALEKAWSQVPYEEGLWRDAEDPAPEQMHRLNLRLKTLKIKYDARRPQAGDAPSSNVPGDNSAGRGFAQNKETGRIAASSLPKAALATDHEAYMLHGDVAKALENIENMLSPDSNDRTNTAQGDLLSEVHDIRDAMGASPTEVLPRPFVHRAAAMDDALELDDAAKRDPDLVERPRLSTEERKAVKKAASAISIYVQTDPSLSHYEAQRLRKSHHPVDKGAMIEFVDALQAAKATDSDVSQIIKEELRDADSVAGTETSYNLIKAVLRIGAVGAITWWNPGVGVVLICNELVKHEDAIDRATRAYPSLNAVARVIISELKQASQEAKDMVKDILKPEP